MQLFLWNLVFFFFKPMTAYEVRISDWSSDVCSSDLADRDEGIARRDRAAVEHQAGDRQLRWHGGHVGKQPRQRHRAAHGWPPAGAGFPIPCFFNTLACAASQVSMSSGGTSISRSEPSMTLWNSSEEHTSELQSLMRNSYAVF